MVYLIYVLFLIRNNPVVNIIFGDEDGRKSFANV